MSRLLGHLTVFLPFQCWCARFGELNAINNIGRTRRRTRSKKKRWVQVFRLLLSETVAWIDTPPPPRPWPPRLLTGTPISPTLLRSFSNDDGDSNQDVKKAIGLLRKTTSLHVITLFCTFLHRPCTTTTWKCLIASFMEDVNKRRRISFSLSKLECGPQEVNSREIRLHLPFSANWIKRDKDWKNGNSS